MKRLYTLDLHNYPPNSERHIRNAVRGIILCDGKAAMVHSKFGEYKFPGGGVENRETHAETLTREVMEEVGLRVVPGSCRSFGEVVERRRDRYEDVLFEHHSFFYYCSVTGEVFETHQSNAEIFCGYRLEWISVKDAYDSNMSLPKVAYKHWIMRDTLIMKSLLGI